MIMRAMKMYSNPDDLSILYKLNNDLFSDSMASEALVLPRMRVIKNREIFFLNKKREIEQTAILEETQRLEKQKLELLPYYLQTIGKLKRNSKALASMTEEAHQASLTTQKYRSTDINQHAQLGCSPSFRGVKEVTLISKSPRKRSVKPLRKVDQMQVVISNGHSHDRTLPYRQRKNMNLLRLKKLKEKISFPNKHQSKTSRQSQARLVYEIPSDEIITTTKYIHVRRDKEKEKERVFRCFENSRESLNNSNHISPTNIKKTTIRKETAPVKAYRDCTYVDLFRESSELKPEEEEDPKLDTLEKKYKSLIQGFVVGGQVAKYRQTAKKQERRKQVADSLFNTLELSGW